MPAFKISSKQNRLFDTPERRLLAAVLLLAVQDYLYIGRYCSLHDQATAEQFIESPEGLGLIAGMVEMPEQKVKLALKQLRYSPRVLAARARLNKQINKGDIYED